MDILFRKGRDFSIDDVIEYYRMELWEIKRSTWSVCVELNLFMLFMVKSGCFTNCLTLQSVLIYVKNMHEVRRHEYADNTRNIYEKVP